MFQFGAINQETMRKQRLIEHINKDQKSKDGISFIDKYLKTSIGERNYEKFRGLCEEEEYDQIIQTVKYEKIEEEKDYKKFQDYNFSDVFVIVGGKLALDIVQGGSFLPERIKESKKGDLMLIDDEYILQNNQSFENFQKSEINFLTTEKNTELLIFDRELWNKMKSKYEGGEDEEKMEILKKQFPLIKKSDNRKAFQLSKYFKKKVINRGYVLTTATSGSKNLFSIQKGRVILFVPSEKLNKNYDKKFIIIQILETNSLFNEGYCLFDKDQNFNTVIFEDETQLLHIDKNDIQHVTDDDSMGQLRANYQGKERLQKAIIRKLENMKCEELQEQQQKLCEQKKIQLDEVEDFLQKSTVNNKFVTFEYKHEKDQKMKIFEEKMKNKKQIDLKNQDGVLMTPRIVSKDNKFKGLDPQAQKSLLGLRAMGVCARSNNKVEGDKIGEVLNKQKDDLLKFDSDLLIKKKTVKKGNEQVEEKTSSPVKQSQKKRMSITQEDALIRLNVKEKMEESKKEEEDNEKSEKVELVTINKEKQKTDVVSKPKVDDKFAAQRKKLMSLGI